VSHQRVVRGLSGEAIPVLYDAQAASPGAPAHRVRAAARPGRAVVGWTIRMVRRGALLLAAAAGGYMLLEVASFNRTYPNGVNAERFSIFADNPAARMLQGVPRGLDTAGGFAVWDGGWVLEIVIGVWAVLVVTRLLRGEEDLERAELLLVGPARARHTTVLTLLVVVACSLVTGAAVSAALLSTGADPSGSALFGVGLAGFAATFAGVAAVTSQILDVRRRAAGFAAAFMAVSFLLRMVANSIDGRAWLGWLTPFGWMDHLTPFGDPQLSALLVLIVAPVLLVVAAVEIRDRRDTGGALLGGNDSRRPRLRELGGPAIFAWRINRPVLTGWVLGLGAYAFVLGALITTMIDFLARDANYQRTLADLGLGVALTVDGFVGVMSVTLGVGFALYAAWRIGAVRSEEESGRADNLLTLPLTRSRWLLGHAGLTVVGAALLTILTGLSMWAGASVSGSEQLTLVASLRAVLNTGSVVVLITGLALLTFGVLPRLTVAVPAAVTVGGYVLTLLGPALSWPGWIIDLSPFTHLAYVPAQPFAVTSATVIALIGCIAGACGVASFSRRDITGA
jgi:polyether ionophore transport system permease protein